MTNWPAAIVTTLILTILAILGFRKARSNWREFRHGVGKPILYQVTAQEIADIPLEWPEFARWPGGKRWPSPFDAESPLKPTFSEAYARLAERAEFRSLFAAEVFIVVGSAWLGLTIPDIIRGFRENRAGDIFDPARIYPFLPVLIIWMGMLMRVRAREYRRMWSVYDSAARADEAMGGPLGRDSIPDRPDSWLRRLMRRLV